MRSFALNQRISCFILTLTATLLSVPARAQTGVEWVATTSTASWAPQAELRATTAAASPADVEINLTQPLQTIDEFGACF